MSLKVMSLCSGIGGLELGLADVFDSELVAVAETDRVASELLADKFNVPNLGDIVYGGNIVEADMVVAGFPCQPVSVARGNNREGVDDERWIIKDVCRMARDSGAEYLLLENVRGILTASNRRALARVCAEMAYHGYTRWAWQTFKASQVGAPHRRDRWFCIAVTANANIERLQRHRTKHELAQSIQETEATRSDHLRDGDEQQYYVRYLEAIERWERIIGRQAPIPHDGWRMNPVFVEWMMGFPEGWITDYGFSYKNTIKCLGNAVVPKQASKAYNLLLNHLK